MKIFHILAHTSVIYASENSQKSSAHINPTLNSIPIFNRLEPLSYANIVRYGKEFKHNQVNSNTLSNPTITKYDELDKGLNTLFFSLFTNTVSFFIYNISILKTIFVSIHSKQISGQLNIKEFESLLFEFARITKIDFMRTFFKIEENVNELERENFIRYCEVYLQVKGIHCENLEYSEIKKKVLSTDSYFYFDSTEFDLKFNSTRSNFSKLISDHFNLNSHELMIFLTFINFIHDLISNFYLFYRCILNSDIYLALKNDKALFNWAINKVVNLSLAPISEPFFNESANLLPFDYNNVQLIIGFILTLSKTLEAKNVGRFFPNDVFGIVQTILLDMIQNSDQASNVESIKKLVRMFLKFLNEATEKRKEFKKFEEQAENANSYLSLRPIVNEFFKSVIQTFENKFYSNTFQVKSYMK